MQRRLCYVFRTGSKTQMQWIARLRDSVMERQNEPEGERETTEQLIAHKKKLEVILAVCKAAKKHGTVATEMSQVLLEQVRFLAMEPAVTDRTKTTHVRRAIKSRDRHPSY